MKDTGNTVSRPKPHRARPLKSSQIECKFVGSFYSLDQIPDDDRPQIAFAGRSNVGKSSLLNKLVGERKIAKVSADPGKTRSINFFSVNNRFYFVDLPGYGYAKVSKAERESWGKLIESYLTESDRLIGLVLLLDCRREPTAQDLMLTEWLEKRKLPVIIALTKCDKLGRGQLAEKIRATEKHFDLEVIPFSIVSGVGKNEMLGAMTYLVEKYS
ncbi:MAG TPA: ribosome biogenesis GTP-binding protein YihA/YsxC [candidate division Zixibacteria bacterium]|nr:ribosome biogenesis GTP-binding protein YihA/YsxC [candidate division Zixibacteria bacterium]